MRLFSSRLLADGKQTAALGLAALMLAGCTVQPLYAPQTTATGTTISDPQFAGMVSFDPPADRVSQVIRNAVIFQMNGGGASNATSPLLIANIAASASSTGRFRVPTSTAGQTSAAIVTVRGTMKLTDAATGESIKTIKRSAIAPYDKASQDFANERAELDAENRAAAEVAEQLAALLAIELRKRR